jgi:pantothenate kinase type III
MLLAIDVGNTNIALGLFDGGRPGPRWRLATDQARMPDEYGIMLINLLQQDSRNQKILPQKSPRPQRTLLFLNILSAISAAISCFSPLYRTT